MGAEEFYYHLYLVGDVVPGNTVNVRIVGGPSSRLTNVMILEAE